jgi:tRNA(Ile2) C34 agmatinyltransferase TiaS
MVYDLVGKGLFSGYINWNEGVLYAQQASAMRRKCPNCGGAIELAGRGTFACPYCGSELLLASEDESGVQSASEPAVSEVQS